MPLDKSGSKASVGRNIATEINAGKPRRQAIAIALDVARRAHRSMGGAPSNQDWTIRTMAHQLTNRNNAPKMPGVKPPAPLAIKGNMASVTPVGQAIAGTPKVGNVKPQFPKLPGPPPLQIKTPKLTMKRGGSVIPEGPLLDSTPGRADKIQGQVEDGSYILPSDCVSACGQNNTLAGHKLIEHMISKLPKVKSAKQTTEHSNKPVAVALSGGEHVLSRETVERIGGGDYEKGRRILDHFVMHVRHRHIHQLSKLPPPADQDE